MFAWSTSIFHLALTLMPKFGLFDSFLMPMLITAPARLE
jgi:hypothetical protein